MLLHRCPHLYLTANASAALGMLLGESSTRIETALAVMPMLLMPLMIFGGLLVNLGAVPWYFRWLKYLSPVKRAFVALAKNEFTGDAMGEEAMRRYSIDQEPSIWSELAVLACMYVLLLLALPLQVSFASPKCVDDCAHLTLL